MKKIKFESWKKRIIDYNLVYDDSQMYITDDGNTGYFQDWQSFEGVRYSIGTLGGILNYFLDKNYFDEDQFLELKKMEK